MKEMEEDKGGNPPISKALLPFREQIAPKIYLVA
jgi:hypothetical protein